MKQERDFTDARYFESGAYRDVDDNKLDYEGFLDPAALEFYAEYMNRHRKQSDGKLRDSDNWQLGIPRNTYIKSMWRHFMDVWKGHRKLKTKENQANINEALCAVIFNAFGYLHENLKEEREENT